MGYYVAVSNGITKVRAITYAAIVLAVALAIAVAKNVLAGHCVTIEALDSRLHANKSWVISDTS